MTETNLLEGLLALNSLGWGLACWMGKKQISALINKVDYLVARVGEAVPRGDCDEKRSTMWQRIDQTRNDMHVQGERIAKVEAKSE